MRKLLPALYVLVLLFSASRGAVAAPILQIDIKGAIGPGVSSFVVNAINKSQGSDISAILLTLDTPGGLDSSTREINQAILDSNKPVICFVAPSGARAASAGTYILMACNIAAMSPGTTIGAATPVLIGGGMSPQNEQQDPDTQGPPDMSDKILNDSSAYMRSLAKMRNRPVEWADRFVREAVSVSNDEALEYGIIEYQAENVRSLLTAVNGREVNIKEVTQLLNTEQSDIIHAVPTWRDKFLATISNPNIAYILLLAGIYGLLFEFYSPGLILPAVVGGISLIVALYALQMLPVNYAGLALLAFGLALITAEAFIPSFGILGLGGIAAFVLGSIMLFDTDIPGFRISPRLIGGIAAFSSLLALVFITMAVRAWRRPVVSGSEGMIGSRATVIDWKREQGHVRTHSEVWSATSTENLKKGQKVWVNARNGLILEVNSKHSEGDENE